MLKAVWRTNAYGPLFALCALIASLDRELINSKFTGHAHAKKGKRGGIAVQPHRELKKVTL